MAALAFLGREQPPRGLKQSLLDPAVPLNIILVPVPEPQGIVRFDEKGMKNVESIVDTGAIRTSARILLSYLAPTRLVTLENTVVSTSISDYWEQ